MREIERPAIILPTLHGSGKGALQASLLLRTWTDNQNARLEFPDHWNESDVRGALHAMQGFACAYCHRELEATRGTVDHLRPKRGGPPSGYFWLAYEFANLLLACTWCNSRKGDQFPVESGTAHITYETRAALATEARHFADPTCDPMNGWFDVEWEDPETRGNIKVRRSLDANSLERRRAEKSLAVFRLNIDVDLLQARIQSILGTRAGIDAEDRSLIRLKACRYLPQGAVVHAFIKASRPALLPTPREEIVVFLEALLDKLHLAERIRRTARRTEDALRRLEQICWAFAVIWACPPRDALSPSEIEAWLRDRHLLRLVEPLYRKLAA